MKYKTKAFVEHPSWQAHFEKIGIYIFNRMLGNPPPSSWTLIKFLFVSYEIQNKKAFVEHPSWRGHLETELLLCHI